MSWYADFGGLVTRVGMGSEAKVASSGVARSGGNAAAIGGVIVALAVVRVVRVPAKFAVVFALAFELSLAIGLVSLAEVFAVVVVVVAPVEVLVA